jgi:tetratricopeptide (TPR) repeat protein
MLRRASIFLFLLAIAAAPVAAKKLNAPPEAREGLRAMYAGDTARAIVLFRKVQQSQPDSPLGYLLEVNALWWRMYCAACEIKWNTIDAFKREKLPEDDHYFELADKAIALGDAQLAKSPSAEMNLYVGMGYALKARLYGLRMEAKPVARAGVKAREYLLRASQMDPELGDAYTGLGLYNYFVDALSWWAKMLRFFMGIPGGTKKEGMRLLERALRDGDMSVGEARFYYAKNLRNYDLNYTRAVELLTPLVEEYPTNPVFQLVLGDMHAKLGHHAQAAKYFLAAKKLSTHDAACDARIQQVASGALALLPPSAVSSASSR